MSESLRNDGRVWAPRVAVKGLRARDAAKIADGDRDLFFGRRYPPSEISCRRDVASRNAKMVCDEGRGVGATGLAVFLDFADAINVTGRKTIEAKYGNLFDMYQQITGDNPYEMPMMIFPAVHYTMADFGWINNLMIPCQVICPGEAKFFDHGANRLGASA